MHGKIVDFPGKNRRLLVSTACAAEHYNLGALPSHFVVDDTFLDKAAAFQEIRDCLAAADRNQLAATEAERRINFLVREYLRLG